MAQRRMFSKNVVEMDRFVRMPATAQALYFHLGMNADDDGFVGNPSMVARSVGMRDEDLITLMTAGYIYAFDSGVVVIVDWTTNNQIRRDRYTPTVFKGEFAEFQQRQLPAMSTSVATTWQPNGNQMSTNLATNWQPDVNQSGNQMATTWQPPDNHPAPPVLGIGSDSVLDTPPSLKEAKTASLREAPPEKKRFVPPTPEEVREYARSKGLDIDADAFCDHYISNGWYVGRVKMKDWQKAVNNWCRHDRSAYSTASRQQHMQLSPSATDYSKYENVDDYLARLDAEKEAKNGNV